MSGHSKWATIHRKKGLIDAQRGKVFQKLAKEIMVAARGTNGDIDTNASLRAVVEKARGNNMPKENIQKAIDKAVGSSSDEQFEAIRYEGYAPGGVAIIIDCLTDNKNRTAMMVRSTLTKHGGNLGTTGSVAYMFKRLGVIEMEKEKPFDEIMDIAINADALDVIENEESFLIYTEPEHFIDVKKELESHNITQFITSEIKLVPNNNLTLDDEKTEKVMNLIEALEDLDDVQDVYHNLEL